MFHSCKGFFLLFLGKAQYKKLNLLFPCPLSYYLIIRFFCTHPCIQMSGISGTGTPAISAEGKLKGWVIYSQIRCNTVIRSDQ